MAKAIVFPGQGSQSVGMGKELFEAFSVARDVFHEVDDVLNQKLSTLIFEGPLEELTLTSNAQPALMAVSMAVVRILEKEGNISMGRFQMAAGHSLGEYAALAAAGSITLQEAARLLRIRGDAMQKAVPVGKGGMVAILGGTFTDLEAIIQEASKGGICVIANDNSDGQVVLSGEKVAIDRVPEIAKNYSVKKCIPLSVSAPFHCVLMNPAADAMEEALAPIHFKDPILPIIPNVTAALETQGSAFKSLLVQQVTGQVRWRETMDTMRKEGLKTVFELGSGKVLSGLFKRAIEGVETHAVQTPQDIEAILLTLNA